MTDNLKTVVDSLNQDPELRERVLNASSNDERKQIIQRAGLPLPSQEEVQHHQALADVSGAGISSPTCYHCWTGTDTSWLGIFT